MSYHILYIKVSSKFAKSYKCIIENLGENMNPFIVPIFGFVFLLFVAPALVFGFIVLLKKGKTDLEKAKLQKEMKEIELKKEELRLQILIEENKKYDKLIEHKITE